MSWIKMQYDPNARELCLHLAYVCQFVGNWEGAHKLRNAAAYLYSRMNVPEVA